MGCLRVLPIALAAATAVSAAAGAESDWPHWRGPDRTSVTPESSGWPHGWPPKRLWDRNVGKGCSSPILVDGKLYVMGWSREGRGTDTLFCLDARTGRERWKQSYACPYQGRVRTGDTAAYGGPSSTPSFDGATGWIYTLSTDGDLRCWDAGQQGKLVWSLNLYDKYKAPQRPDVGGGRRDYGYPGSPLILDDLLIVEVGAPDGTVMAFDKKTGTRRWRSEYNGPAGHTGQPVPMTVEGTPCLAVLTLQKLVVMRIDKGHEGTTVGAVPWATEFACNIATPVVAGDRVLVTSAYNHKAATLFQATLGGLRKVWTSKAYTNPSSPVLYRDRVFLVNRALHCVDLATGKVKWHGGGFGNGSCLVTAGDDKVIVFGSRKLVLAEAQGDSYRELSRLDRVVRGTCYPQVTLSRGILVCKDRNGAMVVFSVRTTPPPPDTEPPGIASAAAAGEPTKLRVSFSEPVEKASAEAVANYRLDQGAKVLAARLGDDGESVVLTTSEIKEGVTYTLAVSGVRDRAKKPNTLAAGSRVAVRYVPSRRATDGLLALYTLEEGSGAVVRDTAGSGKPLDLRIGDPAAAKWVPGGIGIREATTVASGGAAAKIIDAVRASNAITIEAWLKPADTRQNGPARIISLSKDPYNRNFTLGQERDRYEVRLRTTSTGENGMKPALASRGGARTRLSHVAYTRDAAGNAAFYVDGVEAGSRSIGGETSNWDAGYRFALGNELTDDRPWLGELHLVAIYGRALTPDEVKQNHLAGPEGRSPRE